MIAVTEGQVHPTKFRNLRVDVSQSLELKQSLKHLPRCTLAIPLQRMIICSFRVHFEEHNGNSNHAVIGTLVGME
eukprot:scaffold3575_cov17-Tisochrysis_lutea.AAC.2